MFMEFDVVCVAFPSWEGDYVKSTIQLMSELAAHRRVLYVDYQYTVKDVVQAIFKNPFHIPIARILGLKKRLRNIKLENGATIYVLSTPPVIPINFIKKVPLFEKLLRFNSFWQARAIQKALKDLNSNNYVVVNAFNPSYGIGLYDSFKPHIQTYYCYDEIGASYWAKDHGPRLEAQYMKMVDHVIVSSEGLQNSKKPFNKHIDTVKNGVDFKLFHKAFVSLSKKNPKKKIGYIGTVDQRIDYNILKRLALEFPDTEIIIVGRVLDDMSEVKEQTDPLRSISNFKFEGAKSPAALMEYLKEFHIGIIPFIKNEQTAAIYPMKINEYLAAGVGVVATDFAPLAEFGEAIHVATNTDHFIEAVRNLLEKDSDDSQSARVAMAKQNSWHQRGLQLNQLLEQLYQKYTNQA